MNDVTQRARRSDALYASSNEGIDRRWLCDRVAYLESKLRETERKLKGGRGMSTTIGFVIGLVAGAAIGAAVMCVLVGGK